MGAVTSVALSELGIVTVDDDHTVVDRGWLVVDAGYITHIGEGDPPQDVISKVDEHLLLPGHVVMPGMVNAHTHLFQTLFRGLADDLALLDWLEQCIWPGAGHMDAAAAGAAAMVGLVENLRSGVTTVIDHQYIHPGADADQIDDAVAQAANALGVRLLLAHGWADRNYHPPLTSDGATVSRRLDTLAHVWDDHELIRVENGPLIPWGCSDEAIRSSVGTARRLGLGTHIHCAETRIEVDMNISERGDRHVPWLHRLGVLGPDIQLAHAIWLDDHELDLIADADAVVVHCPVSNMYLASGVARVLDMRRRGITVALASDGPGSNNRQDMFEVMKSTVLLQKVHHLDAMALQPGEAINMACRGGARAAGHSFPAGTLTVGAPADLVVIDLASVFCSPVHRLESAIVFNCTPDRVRHVMVAGEWRLRNGVVTGIDEIRALREADTAARTLMQAAGLPSRLV
ncbi:MAG: amidohydrolase family protein [Ilumatobacteraceae bacterium]